MDARVERHCELFKYNLRLMLTMEYRSPANGCQTAIRRNPNAGLTHQQLQDLGQQLIVRRRELWTELEVLNQSITARQDCSIADAAEAASLREGAFRANSIAGKHLHTIAEIDDAIMRLAAGRYGVSENTGDPIGYARLALVPWARAGVREEPQ
jgi:RNA polymerase-binding transcription factor